VLSLGAKPRGLKPGNNILILSQKTCAFMFYPKFWQERMYKGDACWWNACSSKGDKCQPWCMQIKWPGGAVRGILLHST
jgi:hypothetical protein